MDLFTPSEDLLTVAAAAMAGLTDTTDDTAKMGIITVDFTESKTIDESTIPADTATFALKTAGGGAAYVDVPELGGHCLVWPEPAGGWDFTSLQASPSGFAYGYRVTSLAGTFLGCKKFPLPVPIDAAGQHVFVGEMALPVNANHIFDPLPIGE